MTTGDTYNVHGQAAAVGRGAHAHDLSLQQYFDNSGIDLGELARELGALKAELKLSDDGTSASEEAVAAVVLAEKAAKAGDAPSALGYLRPIAGKVAEVAEKIGVPVLTALIKSHLGVP